MKNQAAWRSLIGNLLENRAPKYRTRSVAGCKGRVAQQRAPSAVKKKHGTGAAKPPAISQCTSSRGSLLGEGRVRFLHPDSYGLLPTQRRLPSYPMSSFRQSTKHTARCSVAKEYQTPASETLDRVRGSLAHCFLAHPARKELPPVPGHRSRALERHDPLS